MPTFKTLHVIAVIAAMAATLLAGAASATAGDIPTWGPLRGHANPKCAPYHPCPAPTIFY